MIHSADVSENQEYLVYGLVAEEVKACLQADREPNVEVFVRDHPELADQIRQLVPTLLLVHQFGANKEAAREPAARPGADVPDQLGDFRILREVGRGGMGVVYEAQQLSLKGRRVALKVLPFAAVMDPRQVQRFQNEAQAAACLHHTSIVPVHAVGSERGVHFYAMQFIDGQSLAQGIADLRLQIADLKKQATSHGPTPQSEQLTAPYTPEPARQSAICNLQSAIVPTRPVAGLSTERSIKGAAYFRTVAHLGIQAAEALDHAHQHGIIHRDIKPANLMIQGEPGGSAGGVRLWITDFGLAQFKSDARLTATGDLVGTLRYMSPEQALAKRVVVDHRSDVYSLGATLYELLTLEPAYAGTDRQELLRQIAFEEPRPPRRLNQAIPAELETIVQKAMEKNPADRYSTAQELADDLERFVKDEPIRARRPSLVQRSRKWIRRHKPLAAAAAAVLAATLVVAGVLAWVAQDRATRQALVAGRADEALRTVDRLRGEGRWPEALEAARHAAALLDSGPADAGLRDQVRALVADLELVAELDDARLQMAVVKEGHFNEELRMRLYAKAFRKAGLDVESLPVEEVGKRIQRSSVAADLAAALDHWAWMRGKGEGPADAICQHLLGVARAADPHPWRDQVRDALEQRGVESLVNLAQSEKVWRQPALNLVVLGEALRLEGKFEPAVAALRQAQQRHPGDFWVNHGLALALAEARPPRWDEAIRFFTVAVALRPKSPGAHNNLGYVLQGKGDMNGAIAAYQEAIRVKKDFAGAHNNLGNALLGKGDLNGAIAECQEAIRLKKDFAEAHNNLGLVLVAKGRLDDAIAEYQEAIRLKKDYAEAHYNLGLALWDKPDKNGAIAAYQQAIRLKKDFAEAHYNLGVALWRKGDLNGAIAECQEAIRLKKDFAEAHHNLGVALRGKGDLNAAIAAYQEAIRLKKDYAEAHNNLGSCLRDKGDVNGAIAEFQEAIRLKKDFAMAHSNLGVALQNKGDVNGAIAECQEAIRLKKDDAEAHYNLGVAFVEKGRLDEAIAECQEAIRLKKHFAEAHGNLGVALKTKGDVNGAIAAYQEAIRLKKDYAEAHYNLGIALQGKGDVNGAIAAYQEAIRLKKDYAEAHCNLGLLLLQQGHFADGLTALKRGHELGSKNQRWPYNTSAQWVRGAEQLVALDGKLPKVLKGEAQPADAAERVALAQLCQMYKQRYAAAARFYAEAFAAQPALADRLGSEGSRYDAACATALAGCGQGKDAGTLSAKKRAGLRRKALDWLRADLTAWRNQLAKNTNRIRPLALKTMLHWQQDTDFAGVRGAALAKLPEEERPPWQKLWQEVEALRQRAASLPASASPQRP